MNEEKTNDELSKQIKELQQSLAIETAKNEKKAQSIKAASASAASASLIAEKEAAEAKAASDKEAEETALKVKEIADLKARISEARLSGRSDGFSTAISLKGLLMKKYGQQIV